ARDAHREIDAGALRVRLTRKPRHALPRAVVVVAERAADGAHLVGARLRPAAAGAGLAALRRDLAHARGIPRAARDAAHRDRLVHARRVPRRVAAERVGGAHGRDARAAPGDEIHADVARAVRASAGGRRRAAEGIGGADLRDARVAPRGQNRARRA